MKRVLSFVLAVLLLNVSFVALAEESVAIEKINDIESKYTICAKLVSSDESQEKGIEVGDQFMIDFTTDVPAFLTAGVYGTFDNTKAKIIAPVYSNSDFGVLTNQFDNDQGTFAIEGYDQAIQGIEDDVIFSILFEAVEAGEFSVNVSDESLLGRNDINGFYPLNVVGTKLTILDNADGEKNVIIKEPEPLTPYDDMLGYDWAEKAVGVMYKIGALENIADKSFFPAQNITRGEFITMLMRVCKQKKSAANTEKFNDVAEDYQYEYIMTAKTLGVAQGDENGNFRPDDFITREDICTLVFRTMLKMNKARSEIIADDYVGKFSDNQSIYPYAKDSVAGLIRAKLIIGDNSGLLRPKDNMTRAEAAVLLNRLAEYNILISM